MTRPLLFICALALVAIIGCGDGDSEPAACVSTTDAAIEAAARAHVKNVAIGGQSGKTRVGATAIDVSACRSSDSDGRATVTVSDVDDDAVQDVRHALVLHRDEGKPWRIVRDGDTYRCRPGHGKESFAPQICS